MNYHFDPCASQALQFPRPPHTDAERTTRGWQSRRLHLLALCVAAWLAGSVGPLLPEPPAAAVAPGRDREWMEPAPGMVELAKN